MSPLRVIMAAAALAAAAHGAPDPGVLLTADGDEGGWKALVDALAAKGTVRAPFSERRYFSFRNEPTLLRGVLRISPERGLSLQYTEPEATVLVADKEGLILRDRSGRDRTMPQGSREAGAIASLLPIMRFDIPALTPRFVIRGHRDGAGWTFEFEPRDPDVARALGSILVGGTGSDVTHLEFRRSALQRIEIDVGEPQTGVAFTADELRRFFR